jgi:hypothetical protein
MHNLHTVFGEQSHSQGAVTTPTISLIALKEPAVDIILNNKAAAHES